MGHVQPQNYRPAPGAQRPAVARSSRVRRHPGRRPACGQGLLGLVVGGGVLAFVSLFLVVPFLLANTGVTGFVIGFFASLIPLGAVLLAVHLIDRWEPEPKRLLLLCVYLGCGGVRSPSRC